MIKSTKTSLKFSNTNKLKAVSSFIDEYKRVTQFFVDYLWPLPKIPVLLPKDVTSQVESWLSKRALQCSAKQASGIVRGTQQKDKQRNFKYNQFLKEGKFKKARKLKRVIEKFPISKPVLETICPELDSRFVKIDLSNSTSFDGWVVLASFGNKLKLQLPVKRTRHFNKLMKTGHIKTGIRLSKRDITFSFEMPDIPKKDSGSVLGIDIGSTNAFTCSDSQINKNDRDGWNLSNILDRLSGRKKGSKGFEKTQSHRTNYINWSINQLNLTKVKKVRLENIKYLRTGCRSSRKLSHWTYTAIFDKLEDYCSQSGVQTETISPTYTSQRCSQCGWVRKNNRKKKLFRCTSCGFSADADLNASSNIALDLSPILKKERLLHKNRTGFYWPEAGKEPIVPYAQKE
jgi:transposase